MAGRADTRAVNEKGVVKQILNAVKREYPQMWHLNVHGGPMQRAGVPDLLFSVEGRLVGIEVKHQKPNERTKSKARKRTTTAQRVELAKIRASGGISGTALDATEALRVIRRGLS